MAISIRCPASRSASCCVRGHSGVSKPIRRGGHLDSRCNDCTGHRRPQRGPSPRERRERSRIAGRFARCSLSARARSSVAPRWCERASIASSEPAAERTGRRNRRPTNLLRATGRPPAPTPCLLAAAGQRAPHRGQATMRVDGDLTARSERRCNGWRRHATLLPADHDAELIDPASGAIPPPSIVRRETCGGRGCGAGKHSTC